MQNEMAHGKTPPRTQAHLLPRIHWPSRYRIPTSLKKIMVCSSSFCWGDDENSGSGIKIP